MIRGKMCGVKCVVALLCAFLNLSFGFSTDMKSMENSFRIFDRYEVWVDSMMNRASLDDVLRQIDSVCGKGEAPSYKDAMLRMKVYRIDGQRSMAYRWAKEALEDPEIYKDTVPLLRTVIEAAVISESLNYYDESLGYLDTMKRIIGNRNDNFYQAIHAYVTGDILFNTRRHSEGINSMLYAIDLLKSPKNNREYLLRYYCYDRLIRIYILLNDFRNVSSV
ncbi:hypothetical protein [uncultured Bacteroides sp.]|uniref:hypothetical protein n=1 Tax=uncultured Bacteroides sp. TaxID=162156 RepID=UPI002622E995|nr:hypothetical protein [uncultured Bacteroides sp.]